MKELFELFYRVSESKQFSCITTFKSYILGSQQGSNAGGGRICRVGRAADRGQLHRDHRHAALHLHVQTAHRALQVGQGWRVRRRQQNC